MSLVEPPPAGHQAADDADCNRRQTPALVSVLQQALDLDRVVHEPARLAILAVLNSAEEVDFTFLQTVTGLTKGNLSRHTAKLEEAGYIAIRKYHRGKIPATAYRITPEGQDAFARYWEHLNSIGQHVRPSSDHGSR